ncbi:unnamed protein product [Rotaria socialis]|uniref:UDP-glucuronosyltransferase n=2 Tax=Rotaria socialis TaxID=392032 RepID=A0A817XS54_9BILA|nr:unnamed protein product [Rotaria socialis]CAF4435127.1 unnamed protein product [Rotaria socialis]
MHLVGIALFWLITCITHSFGFNALMISIGAAGHVTPMFELAKAMKNHNVTFITEPHARSYLKLKTISNKSSLNLIYVNDSTEAFIEQKKAEQEAMEYFLDHSLVDNLFYLVESMPPDVNALMNTTVNLLLTQQYDVTIANSLVLDINSLCFDTNIPCVIHMANSMANIFDTNIPIGYSLLTPKQIRNFGYRIYSTAFTIRLLASIARGLIKSINTISRALPRISGPYYESFAVKNILREKHNLLKLYSVPPTLFPLSYPDSYSKYIGGFINDLFMDMIEDDLTRWIKSKRDSSILYAAFGSIGIIRPNRMKSLLEGLAIFLLQTSDASILLAFLNANHDTYVRVLNEISNNDHRRILSNTDRVRVENGFIPQKWILEQSAVGLFISHCGMGSLVEGLYFEKPILCLPLHTDQFVNAIAVDQSKIGKSLFVPPSPFESFLNPHDFHDYKFSTDSVIMAVSSMWMNSTYKQAARIMSLEMRHAGGLKRAAEEIELFVNLKGDRDRYQGGNGRLEVEKYIKVLYLK